MIVYPRNISDHHQSPHLMTAGAMMPPLLPPSSSPPPLSNVSPRPFSSGSRQPPDPIDQHLARVGYYRKHTARDSTSLYRCVSEQMFDTQIYHEFVRAECLRYMRGHREMFAATVGDRDYDQYLADVGKPRAHGSLVELRALAKLYGRNVLLFEPFNTGAWFVRTDSDDGGDETAQASRRRCLKLFYTSDGHFDTVYDQAYIEDAAFCQGLCYEIMYSFVFNLPDVMYAVERMLHDPPEGTTSASVTAATAPRATTIEAMASKTGGCAGSESYAVYSSTSADGYEERMALTDGRVFMMDRPERTRCVLENYTMCHFHNRHFEQLELQLRRDLWDSREPVQEARAIRQLQAMLPERYMSCVRQLLDEGITPFPYKVAKALDPSIYRNVEFDTWSEYRKEQRMRYLQNGQCLQVGARCHVRLQSSGQLYVCHVQEIRTAQAKCFVFIEGLGEKRFVPISALSCLEAPQTTTATTMNGRHSHQHRHHEGGQQQQSHRGQTLQVHRFSASMVNHSHSGSNASGGHRGYLRSSAAITSGSTNQRTSSTQHNRTTSVVIASNAAATTTSSSSASSSTWVHNKSANGGHGWISNGGRRYGFTKNTCNHNKVTAALAQKQETRHKSTTTTTTTTTILQPKRQQQQQQHHHDMSLFSAGSKLFDGVDDGGSSSSKLLNFGAFDDSLLGEHTKDGDLFGVLTSMEHFEPPAFEKIAAPFIVSNNSGGNYRGVGKQQQQQHNHQQQSYKHSGGLGGGKKKGTLNAGPSDSQSKAQSSNHIDTPTASGGDPVKIENILSPSNETHAHHQHQSHTVDHQHNNNSNVGGGLLDAKDSSTMAGYNPFSVPAMTPCPMVYYYDQPWNSGAAPAYEQTTRTSTPSQPASGGGALFADHRGQPLLTTGAPISTQVQPIGYGTSRGGGADRSGYPVSVTYAEADGSHGGWPPAPTGYYAQNNAAAGPAVYGEPIASTFNGGGTTPPNASGPMCHNANAIPVRRRDLLEQQSAVNLEAARPSYDPSGYDMNAMDVGTQRFFYNLGHEYWLQLKRSFSPFALQQLARPGELGTVAATSGSNNNDVVESLTGKMNRLKMGKGATTTTTTPSGGQNSAGRTTGMGESRRGGGGRNNGHGPQRRGYVRNTMQNNEAKQQQQLTLMLHHKEHQGVRSLDHFQHAAEHANGTPSQAASATSSSSFSGGHGHGGMPLLSTPLTFGPEPPVMPAAAAAPGQFMPLAAPLPQMAPPPPPPSGAQYQHYIPYYPVDEQQYFYDHQLYMQMQYGLYPAGGSCSAPPGYAPAFATPYGMPQPMQPGMLMSMEPQQPQQQQQPLQPMHQLQAQPIVQQLPEVAEPNNESVTNAPETNTEPGGSSNASTADTLTSADVVVNQPERYAHHYVTTATTGPPHMASPHLLQHPQHPSIFYGQPAMAPQGYWYPPPGVIPVHSPALMPMPAMSPGGGEHHPPPPSTPMPQQMLQPHGEHQPHGHVMVAQQHPQHQQYYANATPTMTEAPNAVATPTAVTPTTHLHGDEQHQQHNTPNSAAT